MPKCSIGSVPLLSATLKEHGLSQTWARTQFLTLQASGSWINCTHRSLPAVTRFFSIFNPRALKHIETTTIADIKNEPTVDSGDKHAVPSPRPRITRTRWKAYDLERFRKLVSEDAPFDEIQLQFPDRTTSSLQHKLHLLRDRSDSKRTHRWSSHNSEQFASLVKAGMSPIEIHKKFPERTLSSIITRASRVRLEGTASTEFNIIQRALDAEDEALLMKTYQMRNNSVCKRGHYRRSWTAEEVELLEERYNMYAATSDPSKRGFWSKVAGEVPGHKIQDDGRGIKFTRTSSACRARWLQLHKPKQVASGRWDPVEIEKLMNAIRDQRGKDLLVSTGVQRMIGRTSSTQPSTSTTSPAQGSESTALTDDGAKSKPLMDMFDKGWYRLDWDEIAKKVGTRHVWQCQNYALRTLRRGNLGRWSEDERERLREGLELYGTQWQAVARHVRTRSAGQVALHLNLQKRSKSQDLNV
ncbi:hypothetical protein BGZ51_008006 [Haplosporangium sp. Z 767]|nr:hypothetical protein BGZ50_007507 [Haplosporangium sp. Z 11]KAF9190988.1 hypothetical protein BGZ51_008006 [Haplosporangium sp. Z 767]